MPKNPRFKIVIPESEIAKRYNKRYQILRIKDTKKDRRGRKPLFILSKLGGFFTIRKEYASTNRTTSGYSWDPGKQRRMMNIRGLKK